MADEWDRFPDASSAAPQQAAPTPSAVAQPRSLPPGSDGGYSIDPETGHLVIHIGGHRLHPQDAMPIPGRPDVGDVPLPPEVRDRLSLERARAAGIQTPNSAEPDKPLPVGREGAPQYVEGPGMRLPSPSDLAERPGFHAAGIARNLPMMMGYTGGPAGAISQAPAVTRLTEPVAGAARAVGDVAGRVLTASPKTTAATAAGAAVISGAGEAGDDPKAQAASKQSADDASSVAAAADQLKTAMEQRKSLDSQRATAVAARDDELRGKNGKTAGPGASYKAKDTEVTRLSSEMERLDATIKGLSVRSSPEYLEYIKKVRDAEGARQDILDKSRKPFETAYPQLAKNWWLAPIAVGGLTALAMRGRMDIPARGQASRWWEAVKDAKDASLTPAQRAEARINAERFEEAMPKKEWSDVAKSYAGTMTAGAVEGAGLSNVPEIHDLFLPADNPERKAYEEYVKRLPLGHPEIARTVELLKSMPVDNPVRRGAVEHFTKLYPAIVRAIEGASEGMGGAMFGTTASKVIAPSEAALPRPETRALIDAAAARSRSRSPNPSGPAGPEGQPQPLSASPSPGDTSRLALPPPSSRDQSQSAMPLRLGPPANDMAVESWKTPSGETIKRGKSGKTWHDGDGNFAPPPPKGSKRLSELDNSLYMGGFA